MPTVNDQTSDTSTIHGFGRRALFRLGTALGVIAVTADFAAGTGVIVTPVPAAGATPEDAASEKRRVAEALLAAGETPATLARDCPLLSAEFGAAMRELTGGAAAAQHPGGTA